ncbi:MAG TPA: gliding motility-associated C-terminal domain-containing protein [Bacteroidia bacterium]|jgi:gliding motility-associated-like protein|nr:gliding motility-associated C-terminal domain-containing protein [Bacteroidia bacterium]
MTHSHPFFAMCRFLGLFFLFGLESISTAQTSAGISWMHRDLDSKVFIENKGQFDSGNTTVKYGARQNGVQFLFTAQGLTCVYDSLIYIRGAGDNDKGEQEQEFSSPHIKKIIHQPEQVSVYWSGGAEQVQLQTLEKADEYFNSCNAFNPLKSWHHIPAWHKLVYKNLYPLVDAEYEFHPLRGLTYKLIIHPGGVPGNIRLCWIGNGKGKLDNSGNWIYRTRSGKQITDHAPQCWYADDPSHLIPSGFVVINSNTLSFRLGSFDASRTLIIDPWIDNSPVMPSNNRITDIRKDTAGNVYVYGGQNPFLVKKYNSSGTVIWTYDTQNSGSAGALEVDPAGNCFISDGIGIGSAPGTALVKLSPSGVIRFALANPNVGTYEYWRLAFSCDYSILALGGAFINGNSTIASLDTATGAITNANSVADTRCLTGGPDGNFYGLDFEFKTNSLCAYDAGMNSIYTHIPTGYGASYGGTGTACPFYTGSFSGWEISGQNGIVAGSSCLYTSKGDSMYCRNPANGARIAGPVAIPGGQAWNNSGIAVDKCGNVYVGSQHAVYKFNPLLNIQLGVVTLPGSVYDVRISSNGEILACGDGFVASLNGLSACAPCCAPPPIAPSLNLVFIEATCYGVCDGSASAFITHAKPPVTYSWSRPDLTTAAVTGLCPGTYSVTVSDSNGFIGTQNFVIASPAQVILTNPVLQVVYGDSIGLHAGSAGTCSWLPSEALSCSTCPNPIAKPEQTTTYCCTVSDTLGCKSVSCTDILVDCGEEFVPNLFSPNGDGKNDLFCMYGPCIKEAHLRIYDRWGEKVFESDDKTNCWDGMYQGMPMNTGVYIYTLQATLVNGSHLVKKGSISLIR